MVRILTGISWVYTSETRKSVVGDRPVFVLQDSKTAKKVDNATWMITYGKSVPYHELCSSRQAGETEAWRSVTNLVLSSSIMGSVSSRSCRHGIAPMFGYTRPRTSVPPPAT